MSFRLSYRNNGIKDFEFDSSGNGNHGITSGNIVATPKGKISSGLQLSGATNDTFLVSSISNWPSSSMSVSFWIKATGSAGPCPISYAIPTQTNEFALFDTDGSHFVTIEGNTLATSVNIITGEWTHCAVTWRNNDGLVNVYRDMSLEYSGDSFRVDRQMEPNGTLVFGHDQDSVGGGFESAQTVIGTMDEVTIHNRFLNSSDINILYNGGYGMTLTSGHALFASGLIGYWQFNSLTNHTGDFTLEKELEKKLDSLKLKVSRRIDNELWFNGFNANKEIILRYDNNNIFAGRVKDAEQRQFYEIDVFELGEILKRKVANQVFENKSPEFIFEQLISGYTDLTTNIPVASGVTLTRFVASESIDYLISKLAQILDWQIKVEASGTIYFQPRGYTINGNDITRTSSATNAKFGKWTRNNNELTNHISLTGADLSYNTQETATGDGSTKIFNLLEQPKEIRITIDGTEQDQETYTVNSEGRQITFTNAPDNSAAIIFDYTYSYPVFVERKNQTSIDSYGDFHKKMYHKWLRTRADAISYVNRYFEAYDTPLFANKLLMPSNKITTYDVGELVRIDDDLENLDDNYIIQKIKLEYLKGIMELSVGSYIPSFSDINGFIESNLKDILAELSKGVLPLSSDSLEFPYFTETLTEDSLNYINHKSFKTQVGDSRGDDGDARVELCECG